MGIQDEVELLKRIPMFANLERAKLKLLAFTSERLTYAAGTTLFRQHEMGDAAYILVDGEADVLVEADGREIPVARLGPNDFVGEIAILCDVPRTATVRATAELTVLKITKELFFRLIAEFPQMAVEIMRVLAQRLERTTKDATRAEARLRALEQETPSGGA
jgi:CRP-like cAMP-binding protein